MSIANARDTGWSAHLVGTTKTRPKALPLPARHERGEGRGEGFVYSFDVVPGASFVIRLENPLDDPGIVNDGDDLHWVLAHRAPQRVHLPNTEDQVAPPLGGQFQWRWR